MGLHQNSHFWYQAEFSEFQDLPSLPLWELLLSVFIKKELTTDAMKDSHTEALY